VARLTEKKKNLKIVQIGLIQKLGMLPFLENQHLGILKLLLFPSFSIHDCGLVGVIWLVL
jgi:hypothetical protein